MTHTNVKKALDRLKREITILLEMQDNYPALDSVEAREVHNRLILAQGKKVRASSNLLVREIARERDELRELRHSHAYREIVRHTDPTQLQPKEGTSE